jgi:hypothetical protein
MTFSHYALLRVEPDAPPQQVQAAFTARIDELPTSAWGKILWRLYSGASHESLTLARDTLVDAKKRADYDLELSGFKHFWPPAG